MGPAGAGPLGSDRFCRYCLRVGRVTWAFHDPTTPRGAGPAGPYGVWLFAVKNSCLGSITGTGRRAPRPGAEITAQRTPHRRPTDRPASPRSSLRPPARTTTADAVHPNPTRFSPHAPLALSSTRRARPRPLKSTASTKPPGHPGGVIDPARSLTPLSVRFARPCRCGSGTPDLVAWSRVPRSG